MLLMASAIAFCFGLFCILDSEFAGTLLEFDARLMGIQVERTTRWEKQVLYKGFVLMVLGGTGALVALGLIAF